MEDWLITVTANVAGHEQYGFQFRKACARKVFENIDAHLFAFQEFTEDNVTVFDRHGHAIVMGETLSNGVCNAISYDAARLERLDHGTIWLSPDGRPGRAWDAMVERNALWARFEDKKTDRLLLVVNTQFDNQGAEARAESMRILLRFLGKHDDVRQKILLGDLNMSVGRHHPWWSHEKKRPYYEALESGFKDAWLESFPQRQRLRTFHHYQGEGCGEDEYGTYDPDYVLVSGMQPMNSMLVRDSCGGVMPSDHYWIVTHIGSLDE